MRISRIFVTHPLHAPGELVLTGAEAHYLSRVLRVRSGFEVILFNGAGGEYRARVAAIGKNDLHLALLTYTDSERESPLTITLAQGIAKPEHMDIIIQKAVELGAQRIVPVITEYTQHFDPQRSDKRQQHWQKIIINACMQCGRNRLPILAKPLTLAAWLTSPQSACRLVLAPGATQSLRDIASPRELNLLIGAEGGFSSTEMHAIGAADYTSIGLGARILRTETAALSALAAAQVLWGDMGQHATPMP